jgi:hypothetical protein
MEQHTDGAGENPVCDWRRLVDGAIQICADIAFDGKITIMEGL